MGICSVYISAAKRKYLTDLIEQIAHNSASFGGNLSLGFVVGGVSAGANIVAVLAHTTRDENLTPPP
jgi:acetyl esterase/lipase